MLQMAIGTDKGPFGLIGINAENLRRLKAGMPLDIDLKAITPQGTRLTRVIIHYADTYTQVVDDFATGGMPVNDAVRREAQRLDEQLERERQSG